MSHWNQWRSREPVVRTIMKQTECKFFPAGAKVIFGLELMYVSESFLLGIIVLVFLEIIPGGTVQQASNFHTSSNYKKLHSVCFTIVWTMGFLLLHWFQWDTTSALLFLMLKSKSKCTEVQSVDCQLSVDNKYIAITGSDKSHTLTFSQVSLSKHSSCR